MPLVTPRQTERVVPVCQYRKLGFRISANNPNFFVAPKRGTRRGCCELGQGLKWLGRLMLRRPK